MLSNYAFLTDHSYSLRPVVNDDDELLSGKRKRQSKKHRKSSKRTSMIISKHFFVIVHTRSLQFLLGETILNTNRTASIDRNSSDKENHSIILSNLSNAPISSASTSINSGKSSTHIRSNKTKTRGARRTRLSARTNTSNKRSQAGKGQNKSSSKVCILRCIIKAN